VKVAIDDKTELLDLFAKILTNATKILLKRGIDKTYVEYENVIAGVKGKLNISETLKGNYLSKQKTVCAFDDFSSNTLLNQILVTTLYRLLRTKGLDKDLADESLKLLRMLPGIEPVELKHSLFNQIRLTRNNRFYEFIMNVCHIIYDSTLPSEQQGKFNFADFTRDERKMNKLFEEFIRNFYRLEQNKYTNVGSEIINWQFDEMQAEESQYLPQMKTDITLQNETEKIIIDAKYYSETMIVHYEKEKIKSVNLYQLFSYLENQETKELKTKNATGILLYPTIENDYNLNYKYKNHSIKIRTVNLNSNWKNIEYRLKQIAEVN